MFNKRKSFPFALLTLCLPMMLSQSLYFANSKADVLHVRLTDLHAAHQNLPFPTNRTLPLN